MIHIHVYIHIHTQIHDYMSYTHRYTYTYILMCVHALICIHIIYPNISIQGISQQREHILCMSGLHVDVFSTLCIHCKHRSVCNVFAILWIIICKVSVILSVCTWICLQFVCNVLRIHCKHEPVCNVFAILWICFQCVCNIKCVHMSLFAIC